MKTILTGCLLAISLSAFSQVSVNRALSYDSLARKHELHVNAGLIVSGLFSLDGGLGTGTDILYVRSYKGSHFLRAGLGLIHNGGAQINYSDPAKYNLPDTADYNFYSQGSSSIFYAKAGYAVSLGRKKTRFLFGADLIVGYTRSAGTLQVYKGLPYDSINSFSEPLVFEGEGYRGVYAGINPHFTVRHNFSPLFSMGLTIGAIFANLSYLGERKFYSVNDVNPPFIKSNISYFDIRLKPELNLIFKIPPSKKSKKAS